MEPFVFATTARIVFRPGGASDLGRIVDGRCGSRVLLVTDVGLRRLGLCDAALQSLSEAGVSATPARKACTSMPSASKPERMTSKYARMIGAVNSGWNWTDTAFGPYRSI